MWLIFQKLLGNPSAVWKKNSSYIPFPIGWSLYKKRNAASKYLHTMHTVVQLVWVTFLLVLYCSEHNAHKENFDKHDAKINQNTLKSFFSCLKRSWHPDVFFFFFRLKKNMKIELTVHLGTLLTHTVHRYAQFSLSYSYILGLKKTWAFLYGEVCRKLKVIPPSPS